MIATPLVARPLPPRAHAPAKPEATTDTPPAGQPSLEERIETSVDAALAEALAKVKTPADEELAKQQQAFDRALAVRTEREREANAIREFGLAQAKKENDFLQEFIRMI